MNTMTSMAENQIGYGVKGMEKGHDVVLASCVVSIGLAIYLYAQGKREAGIFVGLWAPTLLSLGAFLKRG
jgi:hypothetical protein